MADVPIPPEKVQDPWDKNVPGLGLGRDPERTPMQWDLSPNAGFTTGEPWLPIASDYEAMNVATQAANPRSMLSLYRALLALRRAEPALSVGRYVPVSACEAVLAYERRHDDARLLVALNLSAGEQPLDRAYEGTLLLSTSLDRPAGQGVPPTLRSNEGVVIRRRASERD